MPDPIDPRLGKRLRDLRVARGLSQSQLATPHYTHAYVSQIEAGRRMPSRRVLQHFAEKLDVTLLELETGQPAGLREAVELRVQEARRLLSAGAVAPARRAYRAILKDASDHGLPREEAKARHGLALCDEREGRWDDAFERYEEAEAIAEGHFSDIHADIVAGKARCTEALGDRSHAIYLLDRTIRDLKRRGTDDPLALIKLYAPLAYSACEAGFYTQAAEAAAQAIALEPNVEDPLTLAITNVNVARALLSQREFDAAVRSLVRAEELFDQLDLRLEMGRAHLAHGITLARLGDERAATHLCRSLEVFEVVQSEVDQARALAELGRLERRRGRSKDAQPLLERAIALLLKTEFVGELAHAHRELGLAIGTSAPERAEKNLLEAIALFARAESPLEVAITYRFLGELFEETGRDGCEAFRNAAMTIPLET